MFTHSIRATAVALALTLPAYAADEKTTVQYPDPDLGVNFLEARAALQQKAAESLEIPHGFSYTDRIASSGIDFEHVSVDDSARDWKPVHYDHGNGIASADIDGDGLYDLYFVSQIGSNALYKNLGGGKFRNVTREAGVALTDHIGVTASFGDVDNDGDPDLYVTSVKTGNVLFQNDGKGRFKDITEASGLAYSGHSSGAVFFDYDRDGNLDLFLTNVGVYTSDELTPSGFYLSLEQAFEGHIFPERNEFSKLYRGNGDGTFRDASKVLGETEHHWSGDATFVDFDRDLDPDLYVLDMQGDDQYLENDGKRFVEKTDEIFPKTPWGAMGIKFFDWNNDGRMDLILSDMHSDMGDPVDPPLEKLKTFMAVKGGDNNILGNAFFEQQTDGTFKEISDSIGAENYWPWGLSVGDINADGWQDVFLASSMNYPFRYAVNSMLLNVGGEKFFDSEFVLGIEPRRDGRTHKELFDLDCSTEADKGHKMCAGQSGPITVLGALGTRSSVVFDLEGDGDLDIVTNEFNDVPQVLVSDLADEKAPNWVAIKLRGTRSNRDGLGAHIKLQAGRNTYYRYHDGKSGYLSQSSLPLYFGLGDATAVTRLEILWPSGTKQAIGSGISVGQVFEAVEPEWQGGKREKDESR